jgi:hypothetical protein
MAEIVKGFKFERAKRSSYKWDEWLNGKTWRLVRGVDFTSTLWAFRTALYNAAKARGLTAQTHLDGDDAIVIQASKADA